MGRSAKRRGALWGTLGTLLVAALTVPAFAAAAPAPLGAPIGSAGVGAGQLSNPTGVAVDGSGNLFVADQVNSRISVFSASGSFIHAFGFGVDTGASAFQVCTAASGCQAGVAGAAAGQLDEPTGVAVDGSGNLFVAERFADAGNNRISVFAGAATTPSFRHAFGWDVVPGAPGLFEVCTTSCQAGTAGDGSGQLWDPLGVAVDGSGRLVVADTNHHRINVYAGAATAPSFSHSFGFGVDTGVAAFQVCTSDCETGINGPGAGQLAYPASVALDASGNAFVADGSAGAGLTNDRISVFANAASAPSPAVPFGSSGVGAGQLTDPAGVAVDGSGNVSVTDASNRVGVFSAAGAFAHAFGFGVDTGAGLFEVCTTASGCQAGIGGTGAGQLEAPQGLAADCRGAVFVADTGNNRLQRYGEPGTALPPCTAAAVGGAAKAPFDLKKAIKKCKKKHPKGKKRKNCIKKAKSKAKAD